MTFVKWTLKKIASERKIYPVSKSVVAFAIFSSLFAAIAALLGYQVFESNLDRFMNVVGCTSATFMSYEILALASAAYACETQVLAINALTGSARERLVAERTINTRIARAAKWLAQHSIISKIIGLKID